MDVMSPILRIRNKFLIWGMCYKIFRYVIYSTPPLILYCLGPRISFDTLFSLSKLLLLFLIYINIY